MIERASVWILGNQLLARHPVLAAAEVAYGRENVAVVLIESERRASKHPYQRKKLVLLFSAMGHHADELRRQGYRVDHIRAATFSEGLRRHAGDWQPDHLLTMAASDLPGRSFQQERLAGLLGLSVTVRPNSQFLTSQYDPYPEVNRPQRVVMESFYRRMRRHFGLLMDGDQPAGGQWNYDKENRRPLPRDHRPPPLLTFEPDAATRQVMARVAGLETGLGRVEGFDLAVNRGQALAALDDFIDHRLPAFGPYEDAMSRRHTYLYHSNLAAYLNLGLLEPMGVIDRAVAAFRVGQAPINSVEGFVRQILGWREYIYWQYWRLMPELLAANEWQAGRPLPGFFWHGRTGMACLSQVIGRALAQGYSHHIERLMVVSNFCLLAGIEPAAVNDWFLAAYVDAYEWVMAPNVLGMGLNADGGQIGSKPYIASANYINRMSDYCSGCRYDHRARTGPDACPFNTLYWDFLIRHEGRLRANPRLGPNVLSLRHLDGEERAAVQRQAAQLLADLDRI